MADLHAQFDALKKIITHMTNKETKKDEVPAELWAASGVKPGTRLKDIEKKVTDLKKKVGAMLKDDDIAESLGEAAFARYKASGLSLADFKKVEAAEAAEDADGKDFNASAAKAKDRAVDDKTRDARANKVAGRVRSDDYDEGQIEGLWEGKAPAS